MSQENELSIMCVLPCPALQFEKINCISFLEAQADVFYDTTIDNITLVMK